MRFKNNGRVNGDTVLHSLGPLKFLFRLTENTANENDIFPTRARTSYHIYNVIARTINCINAINFSLALRGDSEFDRLSIGKH